jgi:HD-like signal output (HDOD) protein
MMVLMEEMPREEPDLKRVTRAIQADPGLAGAMLKVVNSPAFGLSRKATSIAQAVGLLGLRNISTISSGLALRHAMADPNNTAMERFWDTAEKVALICAELARRLRGIAPDEAYTLGLFHDCGIPLLMARYPGYRDTLARANRGEGESFDKIEEAEIGTHHAAVGYFVARSWHLPETLSKAILWHHEPEVFAEGSGIPDPVRNFVGLVQFAAHIHHDRMRSVADVEWERFGAKVLAHFGLGDEDYLNLIDGMQETLTES